MYNCVEWWDTLCARYRPVRAGGVFFYIYITKYSSTLHLGMEEVFQHHAHTFEKSDLNFHFQCEFSYFSAEG